MKREQKYIIPNKHLDEFRKAILPFVNYDPHTPVLTDTVRQYTIRSIYFDTLKFDDYYDKRAGIMNRKKIRIRSYNSLDDHPDKNPYVFLEVKRKTDFWSSKNRSRVKWNNLNALLESADIGKYIALNGRPEDMEDAKRFFYHYFRNSLQPVVLIVYEREAFFSKFDPYFRLSIDKHVRSKVYPRPENLFSEKGLTATFHNDFILEVKFSGAFPAWMFDVLNKFGPTRLSVSKYKYCLDEYKVWETNNKPRLFTNN
nr:polyphosphate polymerase domain-containing protein [Bacteroidota bacterium]